MLHVGELEGDGIGGHYCAEKRIKRKSRARLMFSVMEQQNMTDYSPRLLSCYIERKRDVAWMERKPNEQKGRIIGKGIQCRP